MLFKFPHFHSLWQCFLENIIHRANRKKGCREECHVYTWNQVYHVQFLFRICNMPLHTSIQNHFRAANSNYNTIMVDFCTIYDSINVEFWLKWFLSIYWQNFRNLNTLLKQVFWGFLILRVSLLKSLLDSAFTLATTTNCICSKSPQKVSLNAISKKLCFVTNSSGQWEWFSHINFSIIKFFKYPSSLSGTLQFFLFSICLFYCTNKMWAT